VGKKQCGAWPFLREKVEFRPRWRKKKEGGEEKRKSPILERGEAKLRALPRTDRDSLFVLGRGGGGWGLLGGKEKGGGRLGEGKKKGTSTGRHIRRSSIGEKEGKGGRSAFGRKANGNGDFGVSRGDFYRRRGERKKEGGERGTWRRTGGTRFFGLLPVPFAPYAGQCDENTWRKRKKRNTRRGAGAEILLLKPRRTNHILHAFLR